MLLLLYEQMPVDNNGTFQKAQEGKRQRDQMKAMAENSIPNVWVGFSCSAMVNSE